MRFNKTTLAILTASAMGATVATNAMATVVQGTVLDVKGKPVEGATVKIEGTSRVVFTDATGQYRIDLTERESKSHLHLHVYSPNHVHGDNDLGYIDADTTVDFALKPVVFENVLVTANLLETSVLESITPVTVLGEKTLRKRQAATLGETLKFTPGVHSTYYAGVAASPVIRGNDGPRVKIVQNGLDVSDVSRIGPDHAVASDASSATQVEVLRGPATLQYGSGAIGGVVNVVDNRIPSYVPVGIEGEAEVRYATVNEEKFGKIDLTTGSGNWAFHLDAFSRETNDIDVPGFAALEPEEDALVGIIEGSAVDTDNVVAGISYVGDAGFFGFSYQQMNNFYGVPGHAHAHGHDDEHGEEEGHDEHDEEHSDEESVNIDAKLDRYQWVGKWYSPIKGITSVEFMGAYSEYQHAEIEGDELGTQFANDALEGRIDIRHEDVGGWHGVFGLQYANSDYIANGEEAFTPPVETDAFSLFVIEEKRIDDFTFQLGARLERTEYQASDVEIDLAIADVDHSEHDHEDDHGDEHDDEHGEEHGQLFSFNTYDFTSFSASAGMNWHYSENSALALSVSRSERAPSQQELFSGGLHLASRTYELGLVFDFHEDGDLGTELRQPREEVSHNIDLTWRQFHEDWGFSASIFYSDVSDYIYQADTGLSFADEHEEHAEDEHMDDHDAEHMDEHGNEHDEDGYPILVFNQADAKLYGFEFEGHVDINQQLRLSAFGDYIRAKLDSDDLPRIPPLRLGASLDYQWQDLNADIEVVWYDDQDNTARFETATSGYTLLNAGINYTLLSNDMEWQFFARAENITDEEARVHTSFLKDEAPLPGRNFQVGVRTYF
ncbi:TonB-dependent receptor [Alteromonas flava]|uniref:TonB-dependent receptor n=1 Tax=Alteromonas flava TaxID=2048003 RepID=UPI001F0BE2E7|nr:TonB-dependent receptor [Alteromonas flava]